MNPAQLVSSLSPPLDQSFIESLIYEFLDIERRFALGDWEPATLNAGQFAEVLSRLIYHIDSGNISRRKGVDPCLTYIEDSNNRNVHNFPERRAALHLCKVIRTIYKFRSQRGAVHIDPDYSANELDSTLVVSLSRWCVAEVLRLFWTGSTSDIASTIREIIRYEVPAVLNIDDRPLVLRTDCTAEEEILLLLHNAGEQGLSRTSIGKSVPRPASTITNTLKKLVSAEMRQAYLRDDETYVLTPNGTKRIVEELAGKMTI